LVISGEGHLVEKGCSTGELFLKKLGFDSLGGAEKKRGICHVVRLSLGRRNA
jgi:hypothetical protein